MLGTACAFGDPFLSQFHFHSGLTSASDLLCSQLWDEHVPSTRAASEPPWFPNRCVLHSFLRFPVLPCGTFQGWLFFSGPGSEGHRLTSASVSLSLPVKILLSQALPLNVIITVTCQPHAGSLPTVESQVLRSLNSQQTSYSNLVKHPHYS